MRGTLGQKVRVSILFLVSRTFKAGANSARSTGVWVQVLSTLGLMGMCQERELKHQLGWTQKRR